MHYCLSAGGAEAAGGAEPQCRGRNLAAMRAQKNWEIQKIIEEWNADRCTLSIDLEEKSYMLGKIKLDELGQGEIVL